MSEACGGRIPSATTPRIPSVIFEGCDCPFDVIQSEAAITVGLEDIINGTWGHLIIILIITFVIYSN